MAKYIQGIAPGIGPVGSFSYESGCTYSDLSSSFFSDSRGSLEHFLVQVPAQISRSNICIARFVAVPRQLQKQGWGRKLFCGLYNSLIHEGSTLAFLEVDPFIAWPESDELYAREIGWRTAFYETEGWTHLKNQTTGDDVLRIFMYSNPIASSFRDTGELAFSEIDELTHRHHQAESDHEFTDDLDLSHN